MAAAILLFSAQITDNCQALARGLRRRDPELLDALIEQYQYRLFRYLLYLTASPETAEDLFQETWVRVLERGHQYDGRSKFESWLFAIARHLVVDLYRRKAPGSWEELKEDEPGNVLEVPTPEPSPLDLFSQRELQSTLDLLIGRLPAVYREVLVLRFQED